jgi:hypothetical protein
VTRSPEDGPYQLSSPWFILDEQNGWHGVANVPPTTKVALEPNGGRMMIPISLAGYFWEATECCPPGRAIPHIHNSACSTTYCLSIMDAFTQAIMQTRLGWQSRSLLHGTSEG